MVTHYKLVKTSLTENMTAMKVSDRNERARLVVKSAERGCLKNEVGGPAPYVRRRTYSSRVARGYRSPQGLCGRVHCFNRLDVVDMSLSFT